MECLQLWHINQYLRNFLIAIRSKRALLSIYSNYMERNLLLSCAVWLFFFFRSSQSPDQQRPVNTTEWDEVSVWASLILSMTSAEHGRYSKDQTYSLGILSEQLTLPRALELCLVFVQEKENSVTLGHLGWRRQVTLFLRSLIYNRRLQWLWTFSGKTLRNLHGECWTEIHYYFGHKGSGRAGE